MSQVQCAPLLSDGSQLLCVDSAKASESYHYNFLAKLANSAKTAQTEATKAIKSKLPSELVGEEVEEAEPAEISEETVEEDYQRPVYRYKYYFY